MFQRDDPHSLHPSTQLAQPRLRFDYLDGIRGIAALYVVLCHVCFDMREQLQAPEINTVLRTVVTSTISHGQSAVAIFIVLSGYCLMLPIARSTNGELKGGMRNYFKRRILRILPPYYVALLLSLFLHIVIPANAASSSGAHWLSGQPALTTDAILSHILLIHNFNHQWEFSINPPMWSVAMEWQIYFLFPLILLPVWQRFGLPIVLVISCSIALVLYKLEIHSWFIILFTLGMTGAVVGFSQKALSKFCREKISWRRLALFFGTIWATTWWHPVGHLVNDLMVGLATICLIVSCSQLLVENRIDIASRFLGSQWVKTLGTFSYSLYLTHALVLAVTELCLSPWYIQPTTKLLILISTVLPLSVLFAYIFYLTFEKPFISMRSKHTQEQSSSKI